MPRTETVLVGPTTVTVTTSPTLLFGFTDVSGYDAVCIALQNNDGTHAGSLTVTTSEFGTYPNGDATITGNGPIPVGPLAEATFDSSEGYPSRRNFYRAQAQGVGASISVTFRLLGINYPVRTRQVGQRVEDAP